MLLKSTSNMRVGLDIKSILRSVLILVIIVQLLSLGGCISTPAPPSPESRNKLGRVGIIALSSDPRLEFHTFAKGWAAGAAKGGAFGVVDGLLNAITELHHNPPSGQFAGLMTLITLVVAITVSTTVYGVAGGLTAVPAKTAQQIEKELNASIGDVYMANELAEKMYTVARSRSDLDRYAVTHLGFSTSGTMSSLDNVFKQGVDTILEVQFTEAGFRGGSGAQPKVRFYMNVRTRLVATDTKAELYTRDFQFLSQERPFADWFADGSQELIAGLRQAMVSLAERIIDELFLVTDFPFGSGIWALPGQPEFGSCWFYPISPAVKYTSLWHSIKKNEPGVQILYTQVDSLQPLLQWEPFPRPRDHTADNALILRKIDDVTYNLKIWEAQSDDPERLVYDITGLNEPRYRPLFPLKPRTKYFWTFRARYTLEGQSQVTRWAFSNIPSHAASDYPQRSPWGTCQLDAIPSTNYFRFLTP